MGEAKRRKERGETPRAEKHSSAPKLRRGWKPRSVTVLIKDQELPHEDTFQLEASGAVYQTKHGQLRRVTDRRIINLVHSQYRADAARS